METIVKYKEAFEVRERHAAFFTGGRVEWTTDAKHMLCQCFDTVQVLDVEEGRVTVILGKTNDDDRVEDPITTFTLSSDDELLVTSHKNGLFRLWKWKDELVLKLWKSVHKGPVAKLAFGPNNAILASGGTDGCIRIWNLEHQSCTHNFKGLKGVISALKFHPTESEGFVFAAADDATINAWRLDSSELVFTLKGHFSTVTAMEFDAEGKYLVSSGRDKVLILWDLNKEGTIIRTLPTFESIEAMAVLPRVCKLPIIKLKKQDGPKGIHVATGGENGVVRVWNVAEGKEIYSQSNSLIHKASEEGGLAITHLLINAKKSDLAVVSADHNIIIHKLDTFECDKQFVGFSDEVLDVVFLGKFDTHLAVATNSCDIKVYNASNFNCQLVKGHTDIVLSLCVNKADPFLLASSGKDNSVRLWKMEPDSGVVSAMSVGLLHSASVGSVAFSCLSASFLVSASQDTCLKMWKLPSSNLDKDVEVPATLSALHTVVAHLKDINGVCVAPNDKLVASASQDKTVKLWSSDNLELIGVLRGHRRGIWCVRFSPVDQILASASADSTVKLWLLGDLTCWKTFEGHEASVLCMEFISHGMQLLTSGGDGLLKLWTVKTGVCTASWEAHEGRVWAMTVSKKEKLIVSGGSDSTLVVWQDVTEQKMDMAAKERDALMEKEQILSNHMQVENFLPALSLALSLDRPFQVLNIIREIMRKGQDLEKTVKQLPSNKKESLLKCATTWNCNSKNCYPAQLIISILLDELSGVGDGDVTPSILSSSYIEGVIPYTERHFQRLSQLLLDLHLLKFTASQMKPLTK